MACQESLLRLLARCAALLLLGIIAVFTGFLCVQGVPELGLELFFGDTDPWLALTGQRAVWDGIWPACAGTLSLVFLTLLLAAGPGIGYGLYCAVFCRGREAGMFRTAMDVLAGTPSIVMGLFGFTLILFLRNVLGIAANTSLLLSACCLALLVLPVLAAASREAFEALPESLMLTALSLGFTRRAAVRRILLPAAFPGLCGGLVLSLGRAAEDTAVIMLTGAVANAGLPSGLLGKFEAVPFSIFYTSSQYRDAAELGRGFGESLVLLGLSCGLLLLAHVLSSRMRRRFTVIK